MNKTEYLLTCLMEECAEVQQIASKCMRFGLDNHHPSNPNVTNATELQRELIDLDAIKFMLAEEGTTSIGNALPGEVRRKIEKVTHYMGVSVECGTLEANHA